MGLAWRCKVSGIGQKSWRDLHEYRVRSWNYRAGFGVAARRRSSTRPVTFGLLGNLIGAALQGSTRGLANGCFAAPARWVITNLALLGASNGRRETRGHVPASQRRRWFRESLP